MNSKELHVITIDERIHLQKHLRMMYSEIEKVCNRHGLKVCAGYGTVLGALRHHGFIPWDDDMDLLMPRNDYDELINRYAEELPEGIKIYAPNSKNGPITRFAKVVDTRTRFLEPGDTDDEKHGIFIDIFPLEGTSSKQLFIEVKHKITCLLMLIASSVLQYENSVKNDLYKRLMCSTSKGTKVFKIRQYIGFIFHLINSTKWFNLIDVFTRCATVKSGYSVPVGGANKKYFKPIDSDLYFPVKRMKFDDIEIYVPNKSEIHCELEYGDWESVPPENERWQHFIQKISFD